MDTVTTQDSEYVQKIKELEEENSNLKEHDKTVEVVQLFYDEIL